MKHQLLFTLLALGILGCIESNSANAQDYRMRRTNSVGHWVMNIENEGHFYNADDSVFHPRFPGAYWQNPQGGIDTLIFGGGIWIAAKRRVAGQLQAAVSYSYEPNRAFDIFVPGSTINDGIYGDTSQPARERYKVYRSTDQTLPVWPVRLTSTGPHYIDDVSQRVSAGPPFVVGDEDLFAIYKDSDPNQYLATNTLLAAGVEVRSQLSFWRTGHGADVVIVRNEIIHTAADTLFDPVVGLALDGDINKPDDDRLQGVSNEAVHGAVFYTDQSTTDPYLGVVMLSGQHNSHRQDAGLTTLKYWNINEDPVNDTDRFNFLTSGAWDSRTSAVGDARLLMASASHEMLLGFDTLYFDYALYAVPSSGKPALDPTDSARVLHFAEEISNDYGTGKLSHLNGVPMQGSVSSFSVYPNPARDWTTVTLSSQKSEIVRLFDIMGREVGDFVSQSGRANIDLRGLATGSYFLRVPGESSAAVIDHLH